MPDKIFDSFQSVSSDLSRTKGGGNFTDFLGLFSNKPKKFIPTCLGYNDPSAYEIESDMVKKLTDISYGIDSFRRKAPPSYYEYIRYDHREILPSHYLRIGDCIFTIPPEFILINSTSSTDKQIALRQKNTIKTKHGYKKREIVLPLYFTNTEQINGFEVNSPFSYKYYVDGLRPLLAQFMLTPFLPISNEYINTTCGIYNVALSNISVSTVPGFPNVLKATIVLLEFNAAPYIEAPNIYYDEYIDWDLFRYYYQRLLRKNNNYQFYLQTLPNNYGVRGNFNIYCLKEEAVAGSVTEKNSKNEEVAKDKTQYNTSLKDNSNYDLFISNKDNLELTEMSFSLSNILPYVQLADNETVTMQYIGGSDVTFVMSFETTDKTVISKFNDLEIKTKYLTRKYREFNGIGYIKFENELCALTGTRYVMIDEIKTSTIPEMPDLFKIDMQCISYDIGQKDRENLESFKPFEGEGTKKNAIEQSFGGLYNKIKQDLYAEKKMLDIELYPDLYLPTYNEINKAIPKIKQFRNANNLPQIKYDKYEPQKSYVPCSNNQGTYSKYLDPDFYIFYPIKYSDMSDEVFKVCDIKKIKPNTVIAPKHDFGEELPGIVDSEGIINWKANFKKIFGALFGNNNNNANNISWQGTTGSRKKFLELAESQYGKPYVMGGNGPNVFDCSGLVIWCLKQMGINTGGSRTHSQIYHNLCIPITKAEAKPGDVAVRNPNTYGGANGHIVIIDGNNSTIEAMGRKYGVCHGKLNGRNFVYGRLKCLNDVNAQNLNNTTNSLPNPASSTGNPDWNKASRFDSYFIEAGNKYNIDPCLLKAVCMQESSGRNASELGKDSDGAVGPMRVLDGSIVAGEYTDLKQKGLTHYSPTDLLDSRINILVAAQGLRYYNDIHHCNNVRHTLGYYNGGGPSNTAYPNLINKWYRQLTGKNLEGSMKQGNSNYFSNETKSTYEWKDNPDAGKKFNTKVTAYNNEMAKNFGKPIYTDSPLEYITNTEEALKQNAIDENHKKVYINKKNFNAFFKENYMNTMSVDMCNYSGYGKMIRAFPTFVFMILDDSNVWLDARKLWTNYYIYKSIIDIKIHQSYDQPAHTATITLSNIYNNLSRAPKIHNMYSEIMHDDEILGISKTMYKYFGVMPGGAKLTSRMVELKNKLFKHININGGTRIHLRIGYGSNPSKLPIVFNGTITDVNVQDTITLIAQSDGIELGNNVLSLKEKQKNKFSNLQSEPSDIVSSILIDRQNWFLNSINKKWYEANKYGIEHFGMPIMKGVNHKDQYDLCKNIYLGKYKARHFCNDTATIFDGENNINFFLYNRVPWDAMQLCAQFRPEFVCQPMYHQFESRIFYGLPNWPMSYRYDINPSNGQLKEYVKSFAQIHMIDSLNSIIDNQIRVSSKDLRTNCVATYTRGGKLTSTPVLYADRSIDWSKQKTKIIDTSVIQDYAGPDWLYEKLDVKVGKNAAIKVGISNILYSFNKMYTGKLYIIGDASIKPCDIILLDDSYTKMFGHLNVREVIHSFGINSGFITTITPGLICGSTDHQSGLINIMKTLSRYRASMSVMKRIKKLSIKHGNIYSKTMSASKMKAMLGKSKKAMDIAKNFSTTILNAIKNSKFFTNPKEINKLMNITNATSKFASGKNAVNATKALTKAKKALQVGKVSVACVPAIGQIIYFIFTVVVVNTLLEYVVDNIAYNNTINIYPVLYNNKPFVAGVNGQSKLIPGIKDNKDLEYKDEDKSF